MLRRHKAIRRGVQMILSLTEQRLMDTPHFCLPVHYSNEYVLLF